MKKRNGITAGGTWNVDYTKTVQRYAAEGACTKILDEKVSNGGAPYNLLVDLARLEAPFPLRAVGRIGQDLDGASILKDCRAHDIDTTNLKVSPEAATSFSDVMASVQSGVRTSFNQAGANALLTADDFDLKKDPSKILYFGSLFFMDALDVPHAKFGTGVAALLAEARRAGFLTSVDIERASHISNASFVKGTEAALRHTDLVIVNIEIAEMLSGLVLRQSTGVDLAATEDAARILAGLGGAKSVVVRFPTGALGIDASGEVVIEGSLQVPRNRLVNASGAGHAFAAGFLYAQHQSESLANSLIAAHAAGAACLMDPTASGGLRPMEDCLSMVEKFGQRIIASRAVSSKLGHSLL
jgi:sugar/nucleoside kinase (ribokinase family)